MSEKYGKKLILLTLAVVFCLGIVAFLAASPGTGRAADNNHGFGCIYLDRGIYRYCQRV